MAKRGPELSQSSKSRSGDEPHDAAGIDIGEMSPREFIQSG
jgi:hypothetical protein